MNVKSDVNSNLVKFTKKCQTQPPHYKHTSSLICNCPPGPFFVPFRLFSFFLLYLRCITLKRELLETTKRQVS